VGGEDVFGLALAWGIAIAVVATIQLLVALGLGHGYDPTCLRAFMIAPIYPIAYWLLAAAAALHSQTVAVLRGPRRRRVVWDIPREPLSR
jgi:biofilm PGA synthesis N-glycosyltransferase PgaC